MLSDTLGVLVKGKLRALGTSQHLRSKHGGGAYALQVCGRRCSTDGMIRKAKGVWRAGGVGASDSFPFVGYVKCVCGQLWCAELEWGGFLPWTVDDCVSVPPSR